MPQTIQKNIRVTPEQWKHIEKTAREREISPNRLIVDLVMDALDRGEWPGTEAEICVARASLFTAQAIARDMVAAGRKDDIEEIRVLFPPSCRSLALDEPPHDPPVFQTPFQNPPRGGGGGHT